MKAPDTLQSKFTSARHRGVPLVAITTADPAATIAALSNLPLVTDDTVPLLRWDCVNGLVALNNLGVAARADALDGMDPSTSINPTEALASFARLPEGAVAFFLNAHRFLANESVAQAVWNLREPFKGSKRTLVMLAPELRLPLELKNDVMVFDEPLPDAEELRAIVTGLIEGTDLQVAPDVIDAAVDAVRGLSAFAAEQVTAMSTSTRGINITRLWERKQQMIRATPGLKVWQPEMTFDGIGGCSNIKYFINRMLDGRRAPRVVVFMDEIEKQFGGVGTDSSGVTTTAHGTLLQEMQDKNYTGLLFIGPPGAAKSAIAKAIPRPIIKLDLTEMKAGLVGESEANLRSALKVIAAVSDDSALFVATCNSLQNLSPELRRRFKRGTFFFDLPTAADRAVIWDLYMTKYFPDGMRGQIPTDTGWTGSEIEQCVVMAWDMNMSLTEAAEYVIPQTVMAAESISKLRRESHNRFLSAAARGLYQYDANADEAALALVAKTSKRKIN